MKRYALGTGNFFRLDGSGDEIRVLKVEDEKIYSAEVNATVSAYSLTAYGDEAFSLHDEKIVCRDKSRIEIF